MKKIIIQNTAGRTYIEHKAERVSYTAPRIAKTYVNGDGIEMHLLETGNEQTVVSYNAMWHPVKTKVEKPFFKGAKINNSLLIALLFLWSSCAYHAGTNPSRLNNLKAWQQDRDFHKKKQVDSSFVKL